MVDGKTIGESHFHHPPFTIHHPPSTTPHPPSTIHHPPEDTAMIAHPWHDVPLPGDLSIWFPCYIEIPKGSKVKYELNKETGLLMVDRVLYSSVFYPANYGFVPPAYCTDKDP